MNWKLPHKFSKGVFSRYECACGQLKGSVIHVNNRLTGSAIVHEGDLMVSHGNTTHPYNYKCKTCDKIKKEFELDKRIIKQATEYSNLSQWIQMEVWKYIESIRPIRIDSGGGGGPITNSVDLADRIIKKVLEYKDGKTSRKNS